MTADVAVDIDNVFINCPFDIEYRTTFEALVFTIHACGFRPRCALELDDASQTRIEKLYNIIEECRFSVHDLSRTELDSINNLPRFNMPLELGLFLGAKRYGDENQRHKRCLILDTERFRYQKFISDIAGMDIREHGADPARASLELRNWLKNVSRRTLPSAKEIGALYDRFQKARLKISAKLGFDNSAIPYADYENMVTDWLLVARK